MPDNTEKFNGLQKYLWYIPTLVAVVLLIYGGVIVEQKNTELHILEERSDVVHQIEEIRARFEANVNASIQLTRGLVAAVAVEPEMDQARYSEIASRLFAGESQLINLAAAPDLVVSMVYPEDGNLSVIGLDYRKNDAQISNVELAKESGMVVFEGPINLVQGGTGFIARVPVFLEQPRREHSFWGMISTVISGEMLFAQSGMTKNSELALIMQKSSPFYANDQTVFSNASVDFNDPVSVEISIAHGQYVLSAMPAVGWSDGAPDLWRNRLLSLIAGILVVLPIIVASLLLGERQNNVRGLQNNEQNLKLLSKRLELALNTSQTAVWEFDSATEELFWDERMCKLYDVPEGEKPVYQHWVDRLHPDDVEQAKLDFSLALVEKSTYQSLFRIVKRDGSVHHIRTVGSTSADENGFMRITGVNWDITSEVERNAQLESAKNLSEARNRELEETKVRIEHNSLHDSLTGLPNRRFLDEVLSGNHKGTYGRVENFSILHIDLDRFKQINDTLGHAAGDTTLIHAAKVLKRNVRDTDFVARVGGDEFVILSTKHMDKDSLSRLAGRINEEMRRPIIINMRESRCGVSIGVATQDSAPGNPEQLLINADIALYHAKKQGRNTFRFYNQQLHQVALKTKCVADEILTGIEQKQFIVHYQGQFDAQTLKISGVEALARWQHPTRGLLAPDSFIEIAEELNVMATIDAQVLGQALDQMKNWKQIGINVPQVSVNISARRLSDERLIEGLKALKIEPGTLTFEFLETILLENKSDQVAWNIDQIRELGIDIELDDFGTGYASIVSLMQLRPKMLKIDRQLVMPIIHSDAQRELVQSIVNIGSALGIGAVAEGVESLEHARIMAELGCKTLQGYGLARPMSGSYFTSFLQKIERAPLLVA